VKIARKSKKSISTFTGYKEFSTSISKKIDRCVARKAQRFPSEGY